MTETKPFEATQKLHQFWYETSQAVVQCTFNVQDHSIRYAQSVITDGIETLKSHIDASRPWLQKAGRPQETQEAMPSLMESGVEAYKRNVSFLQRTFEHGAETLRNNTEIMNNLTQTLIKKAQEQQNMLWS